MSGRSTGGECIRLPVHDQPGSPSGIRCFFGWAFHNETATIGPPLQNWRLILGAATLSAVHQRNPHLTKTSITRFFFI